MANLTGKLALVTGGTRGIGYAIAQRLAADGARLVLLGRSPVEKGQPLADAIAQAHNTEVHYISCDVADYDAVQTTIKTVTKDFGGVDILVNNAGITRDKVLLAMNEQDWDSVLDTNLKSMFNTIKACYRTFIKKKAGRIINITSVSGIKGNAAQANYTAAKGGVIALTKTVARELATRGVTCNAVAPGVIDTDMTASMNQDAYQALLSTVPMGRAGTPEDVAACVSFLASDDARYITGEVIRVDGGIAM